MPLKLIAPIEKDFVLERTDLAYDNEGGPKVQRCTSHHRQHGSPAAERRSPLGTRNARNRSTDLGIMGDNHLDARES